MLYTPRNPEPPLGTFVETIFHLQDYCPDHAIERVVPDGSSNLIIELDDQPRWVADNESLQPIQSCQGCWISGPHRHYLSISALQNTRLLAIRFRPGGLFPLLQRAISEFSDCVVDGVTALGEAIVELRCQLLQLESPEAVLDRVERWLNQNMDFRLEPPDGLVAAVKAIQSHPTVSTLKHCLDASGYSRKQLIHLFKKHVGLLPKDFQRILRFNQVLASVHNDQPVVWTDLSEDCGYFDQAHFIRDFQRFSGFNPSEFLLLQTDRSNFFPIGGEDSESR